MKRFSCFISVLFLFYFSFIWIVRALYRVPVSFCQCVISGTCWHAGAAGPRHEGQPCLHSLVVANSSNQRLQSKSSIDTALPMSTFSTLKTLFWTMRGSGLVVARLPGSARGTTIKPTLRTSFCFSRKSRRYAALGTGCTLTAVSVSVGSAFYPPRDGKWVSTKGWVFNRRPI